MSKDKLFPSSIEEVLENPNQYGLPTFEQFAKDPEKWNPNPDILESADRGSTILNKYVQHHIYEVDGYRTRSLEKAQAMLFDQGYNVTDCDIESTLLPSAGLKCDVLVKFVKKKQKKKLNKGMFNASSIRQG